MGNKQIEIKIKADLDQNASTKAIEQSVKNIEEKMGKKPAKIPVVVDEAKLKKAEVKYYKLVKNMTRGMEQIIKADLKRSAGAGDAITTKLIENGKKRIKTITAEIKKANGLIEKFTFKLRRIKTPEGVTRSAFVRSTRTETDKGDLERIKNSEKKLADQRKRHHAMVKGYASENSANNKKAISEANAEKKAYADLYAQRKKQKGIDRNSEYEKLFDNIAKHNKMLRDARAMDIKFNQDKMNSEAKLADFQISMAQKVEKLRSVAGKNMTRKQSEELKKFKKDVDDLTRLTPQLSNRVRSLSTEFKGLDSSIRNTAKGAFKLGDAIKKAFGKFSLYVGISSIVLGIGNSIKKAVAFVIEMDTALTNLSKVTTFTNKELVSMKDTAIDLGRELGRSSIDIMNAFAEFGRITKVREEIEELSRAAIIASNVTTFTAETSAKAINVAMIAFKLEAKDSMRIIDEWNELQNNFRLPYIVR